MNLTSVSSASASSAAQFFGLPAAAKPTSGDASQGDAQPLGGGRFASALQTAFASVGISLDPTAAASSSTATTARGDASSTGSTDDAGDAVSSFLQSLFAALHGQSGGAAAIPPSASASDDATPPADATTQPTHVAHAHHGHHGRLEADLQGLIADLGSSGSAADAASTATTIGSTSTATATSTSSAGDTALDALGKSFDALLARSGVASTGSGSLTAFLQSLATSLHGAPATGNVVSTAA